MGTHAQVDEGSTAIDSREGMLWNLVLNQLHLEWIVFEQFQRLISRNFQPLEVVFLFAYLSSFVLYFFKSSSGTLCSPM